MTGERQSPKLSFSLQQIAFAATAIVFLINIVYLYGAKFSASIHADVAVPVLMARKMLSSGQPILRDWYYPNGDVWVLGHHWYALPTVALWGVGPTSLLASLIIGFAVEVAALTWVYRQMTRHLWVALFATTVTLVAWSRLHVIFVYIELSYGFFGTLYGVLFTLFASIFAELAAPESERGLSPRALRRRVVAGAALMFVASLQNPTRAMVFVLVPVALFCAWPWSGVARAARARVAGLGALAWAAAFVVYKAVFTRLVIFSNPSGHNNFVVKDLTGILDNVRVLGQGIMVLSGALEGFSLVIVPALVMLAGAMALVSAEIFRSRTPTLPRLVAVAVVGQLGLVLMPMIVGNLIVNPPSARYLMPSLILVLGLAVVIALRGAEDERRWLRVARRAWLALVPVVAMLSLVQTVGAYHLAETSTSGQWAHSTAHTELANELKRRGLTHGFSTYWNANLTTLLSGGAARTCGVNFASGLVPYKWNVDAPCFDASRLPERVYVVSTPSERKDADRASRESLGEPVDHFAVGDAFDVSVFSSHARSLSWLDAPFPEAERLTFPLRVDVLHPQMARNPAIVRVEGSQVTGTGADGVMVYGPYLALVKGDYRLRWFGRDAGPSGELHFDACAEGGKVLVTRAIPAADIGPGGETREIAAIDFSLPRRTAGVEARVFAAGGARVTLDHVVFERR